MKVGIDFKDVKEPEDYSLIPEGYYKVIIEEYKIKKTKEAEEKNLPYSYLELKMRVDSGSYSGTVKYDRLNINNANTEIMKWHQGILKKIFRLVGVDEPKEYKQLLNVPFMVYVVIKPNNLDPT